MKTVKNTYRKFYVAFIGLEKAYNKVDRCIVDGIIHIWCGKKVFNAEEFLLYLIQRKVFIRELGMFASRKGRG